MTGQAQHNNRGPVGFRPNTTPFQLRTEVLRNHANLKRYSSYMSYWKDSFLRALCNRTWPGSLTLSSDFLIHSKRLWGTSTNFDLITIHELRVRRQFELLKVNFLSMVVLELETE